MIKEYYSRILYCLTLFKGPSVMLWVNSIEDAMEAVIADTTNTVTKKSKKLWDDFLATFDKDWMDSLNKEKAYGQLVTLKMAPRQLDEYILQFERLAGLAGWSRDAPGTVEFFKRGLITPLYKACLMRNTIPETMDQWQTAARAENQRYQLLRSGPGLRTFGPTQSVTNQRQRPRDPNAMDVDATTSSPTFKKLTDEERRQYMKEGRCFRCRTQGHMARECNKAPPRPQRTQTQARATDSKSAEADEAPPTYPEASTSIATTTTQDKVRQTMALIESMNDEEKKRFCVLEQDFLEADL